MEIGSRLQDQLITGETINQHITVNIQEEKLKSTGNTEIGTLTISVEGLNKLKLKTMSRKPTRTPEFCNTIRALQAQGISIVEIAQRLGVSRTTIHTAIKKGPLIPTPQPKKPVKVMVKTKPKRIPSSERNREEIKRLFNLGYTRTRIAQELKVSRSTINIVLGEFDPAVVRIRGEGRLAKVFETRDPIAGTYVLVINAKTTIYPKIGVPKEEALAKFLQREKKRQAEFEKFIRNNRLRS